MKEVFNLIQVNLIQMLKNTWQTKLNPIPYLNPTPLELLRFRATTIT